MLEFLVSVCIGIVIGYGIIYAITSFTEVNQELKEYKMSKNNAILIIPMKDIDKEDAETIYYIGEVYNPTSIVSNPTDFSSFVFNSNVYLTKQKVIDAATELDAELGTQHGVIVFHEFNNKTFGEALSFIRKQNLHAN